MFVYIHMVKIEVLDKITIRAANLSNFGPDLFRWFKFYSKILVRFANQFRASLKYK